MNQRVVCFDLDDTLYKEIDFVESAYREIAEIVGHPEAISQMLDWYHQGENVFLKLNHYIGQDIPIPEYLSVYRNHIPSISLSEGVKETLEELKKRGFVLGLITDGRRVSQRNKIVALGLNRWFDDKYVVISEEFGSEKTSEQNFRYFMDLYPNSSYFYIGDNPLKDFCVPNQLRWGTIMLKDDGRNIHKQIEVSEENMPHATIARFAELLPLLCGMEK